MFEKLKAKLAYERESLRMAGEALQESKDAHPELYVKGYWRMTPEQAHEVVRREREGK